MLNYHFCGYDDDIIYSIDNIRLEFDLKYERNFNSNSSLMLSIV